MQLKESYEVLFEKLLDKGYLSEFSNFSLKCINNGQKLPENMCKSLPIQDFFISVIIPTHNRCEMLKRCINSVLSQTYPDVECIIVDDASTDDTYKMICENYENISQVIYIKNEITLGPGRSRQKGYLSSKGNYIVFLDDDDFYIEKNFFEKALEIHNRSQALAFVSGNVIYYKVKEKEFDFQPLNVGEGLVDGTQYFTKLDIELDKPVSSFSSIFRKDVLQKANFEHMSMMNDFSIYLRSLCFGDAYVLRECVGCYCIHNTNISKNMDFDFLIENLEEKKFIFSMASDELKISLTKWLKQQLMITIKYYFDSNAITYKNKIDVLDWCKGNCMSIYFKVLFHVFFSSLKKYVKRFMSIKS